LYSLKVKKAKPRCHAETAVPVAICLISCFSSLMDDTLATDDLF